MSIARRIEAGAAAAVLLTGCGASSVKAFEGGGNPNSPTTRVTRSIDGGASGSSQRSQAGKDKPNTTGHLGHGPYGAGILNCEQTPDGQITFKSKGSLVEQSALIEPGSGAVVAALSPSRDTILWTPAASGVPQDVAKKGQAVVAGIFAAGALDTDGNGTLQCVPTNGRQVGRTERGMAIALRGQGFTPREITLGEKGIKIAKGGVPPRAHIRTKWGNS